MESVAIIILCLGNQLEKCVNLQTQIDHLRVTFQLELTNKLYQDIVIDIR